MADELNLLAMEKQTFLASHGSGLTFGPCVYACYKGKLIEYNSDKNNSSNTPVQEVLHLGIIFLIKEFVFLILCKLPKSYPQ